MKPGKTGIARIIAAAQYSGKGLAYAWRNEAAFRQEVVLCLILLVIAFFVTTTVLEFLVLVLPAFLLLIVELINSAIEAVVDRFGGEQHALSGAAKDMGSAAVFVCLALLVVIWTFFILNKYIL